MKRVLCQILLSTALLSAGCQDATGSFPSGQVPQDPDAFVAFDSVQILGDLRLLSQDSLEGRRTGTRGGEKARAFIRESFVSAGLEEPPAGFVQPFEFRDRRDTTHVTQGANVVGFVLGLEPERGAIVITAHYDHLGIRGRRPGDAAAPPEDSIFNGADDNASGTAAVMAMARYFARHGSRHTLVFAAVDGEEMGLRGSRAFVDAGWPALISLNVNLDMVARSDSLLFAAGTSHYPQLRPVLEGIQPRPPVHLAFGHDQAGIEGVQDWTRSSDHQPFHARGIPFIYFGVEDHPDYHRASDEFEKVDPRFFLNAVRTILASVLAFDSDLGP